MSAGLSCASRNAFSIDACAAWPGVLQFLENHRTTAVTHNEAVAILVPRTAGTLRIVVAFGQRLGLAETGERRRRRRALRAARDDDVCITVLDAAHAEADGMRRCRAGADHAEVRTLESVLDAEVAGDHVADGARNVERRSLLRVMSSFPGDGLVLDAGEAADTRAHDGAAALAIFPGEVQSGIGDRLDACAHAVVHERIHAARFLGRDVGRDVEAL